MLRHPTDGSQWRAINREFPEFASGARNLMFALSMDGHLSGSRAVVTALGLLVYVSITYLHGYA